MGDNPKRSNEHADPGEIAKDQCRKETATEPEGRCSGESGGASESRHYAKRCRPQRDKSPDHTSNEHECEEQPENDRAGHLEPRSENVQPTVYRGERARECSFYVDVECVREDTDQEQNQREEECSPNPTGKRILPEVDDGFSEWLRRVHEVERIVAKFVKTSDCSVAFVSRRSEIRAFRNLPGIASLGRANPKCHASSRIATNISSSSQTGRCL